MARAGAGGSVSVDTDRPLVLDLASTGIFRNPSPGYLNFLQYKRYLEDCSLLPCNTITALSFDMKATVPTPVFQIAMGPDKKPILIHPAAVQKAVYEVAFDDPLVKKILAVVPGTDEEPAPAVIALPAGVVPEALPEAPPATESDAGESDAEEADPTEAECDAAIKKAEARLRALKEKKAQAAPEPKAEEAPKAKTKAAPKAEPEPEPEPEPEQEAVPFVLSGGGEVPLTPDGIADKLNEVLDANKSRKKEVK
jgi:hypothetical protein